MQTRPFGRSGLTVSAIGLGLAALGRPGYINLGHGDDLQGETAPEHMARRAHDLLDQAWAAGIRYFDVARSYGRGEEFLGAWLRARNFGADTPVVGSKWGYTYTADWQVEAEQHEVKEHTLSVLQRQWQESRGHLSPYLRLYQIHSATFDSGVLTRREVLRELARLKAEGILIGLSLSGANQAEVLDAALAVTVDGVALFDGVQATWNLLEPSCGPMLATAHAAGLGVIVKEAVANGRLTPRSQDTHVLERLQPIAARHGVDVDAVALAAALAQPWASVVLSGAATTEHLTANLAALGVALDEDDLSALATLAETPQDYWSARSRLEWN
jgi:aryl-alcohol dehydrogenase-like predicted oxidoreductase